MVQLLIGMLLGVMAATPTRLCIDNKNKKTTNEKDKDAMKAPTAGEEDNHGESA